MKGNSSTHPYMKLFDACWSIVYCGQQISFIIYLHHSKQISFIIYLHHSKQISFIIYFLFYHYYF